jgi:L,D-transpeptidase YcbB
LTKLNLVKLQGYIHTTMMNKSGIFSFPFAFLILFIASCSNGPKKPADNIAQTPEELQQKSIDFIASYLDEAVDNNGKFSDSLILFQPALVKLIYGPGPGEPVWSAKKQWFPLADSLFNFITRSQLFGLFPEDYHVYQLGLIRDLFNADSLGVKERKDAAMWSQADLLLSDAFVRIVKDVRLGRLPMDSIHQRKDSLLSDSFYLRQFEVVRKTGLLDSVISSLEPLQKGYHQLKAGIPRFLDSADYRSFTYVPPPGKDLITFKTALQKRLYEGGFISFDSVLADSMQLVTAIKKFQKSKNLSVDGVAGEGTLRVINTSDRDRFIRIAITMDRFKLLPSLMPQKYIWVNIPGYELQLIDRDSNLFRSKIICGKPKTRTPVLTSAISELITYPQWVPPPSIVTKEILPAVKKNPGYLARKGFSLVNAKGEEVDPFTVDWTKYNKTIPYRVVQGSGDENALGIMKFNFSNKYSVYLHDTNQRYLFGQNSRAMSHGCVRVQDWQKLAVYLIRNDRYDNDPELNAPVIDSMNLWLEKKEKHSIPIRNRFPVFIRYFTCEGKDGKIVFYDDVYGEDKMLREKYFAGK